MVRLSNISKELGLECELLAKLEYFNPGGSLKDRIGPLLIEEGERSGLLKPGGTVIEPTSGNTGIGLAMACAIKGYKLICCIPDKMSPLKVKMIEAMGGKVVWTKTISEHHPDSYVNIAIKIAKETPNSYLPDQFWNVGNPKAHFLYTGTEILEQCDYDINAVVLAPGTGGSLTGVGSRIKMSLPDTKIVCADPEGSLMALPASLNGPPGSYLVEGPGHEYVPGVMDRSLGDKWYKVSDENSFKYARMLLEKEGILSGGSSGSMLYAAVEYAKEYNLGKGDRVVVVIPDCIRHYAQKYACNNWMVEKGFYDWDTLYEPKHMLTRFPISTLILKKIPIMTYDSTVGDCLTAMADGARILAVREPTGEIILGITQDKLLWFIANKNLEKHQNIFEIWTKEIAVIPYEQNMGVLERTLERHQAVIVAKKDKNGVIKETFQVTREEVVGFVNELLK